MKYMFLLFDEKTAPDLTPEEGAAMYTFFDDAMKSETMIAHQAGTRGDGHRSQRPRWEADND